MINEHTLATSWRTTQVSPMKLISSEFCSSPMRLSFFSAARTTVKLRVYPYTHSFPSSRKDPVADMDTDFQLNYKVCAEHYLFMYLPST